VFLAALHHIKPARKRQASAMQEQPQHTAHHSEASVHDEHQGSCICPATSGLLVCHSVGGCRVDWLPQADGAICNTRTLTYHTRPASQSQRHTGGY
jgi:hypothetical protein